MPSLSTYRGGRILRIKLENFMTYDKLEMVAGAGLNLIVGPNGSGKTSVICAICLGLAGKSTWTGRKLRLNEYIKHGCKEAYIKIQLDDPESKNGILKISRRITRSEHSEFKINNVPAREQDVEKVVSRFNIQVSNMCQFLPQEKVSEFSRMSPVLLLQSVQQTVGDDRLQSVYKELVELRQKARQLEGDLKDKTENLNEDKKDYDRLVPEMNTALDRENMLLKVKLLEEKLVAQIYVDLYEKTRELKTEYKDAKKKAKDFEDQEIGGLSKDLEAVQKELRDQSNYLSTLRSSTEDANIAVEKSMDNLRNLDAKAFEAKNSFVDKKEKCKDYEKNIEEVKLHIAAFEKHYSNLVVETNKMEQELLASEAESVRYVRNKVDIEELIQEKDLEIKNWNQKECSLNIELSRLKDLENRKNDWLKQNFKDTYEAKCWLEKNRHLFKRDILGPLMVLINTPNRRNIKFLEAQIPYRDMGLFLCEDPEDAKRFTKIMRAEKNLKICIACVATRPIDSYKPQSPECLKKFKFRAFLKDLLEAPDSVKAFLCERYKFHNIPVGDEQTERFIQEQDQGFLTRIPFTKFYTPSTSYTIRRSRYGPCHTSCITVQLSEGGLLSKLMSSSESEQKALENDLKELRQKRESVQREKAELENQVQVLNERVEQHRRQRQKLINKKEELKKTRQQIEQKKRVLQTNEEDLRNFDLGSVEREYAEEIAGIKAEKLLELENLEACLRRRFEISQRKCRISFFEAGLLMKSNKIEAAIGAKQADLIHLKEDMVEKEKKLRAALMAAKKQKHKAETATGLVFQENASKVEFAKKYGSLPSTTAGVEAMLASLRSKIACTVETDQTVVDNYRKLEKKIRNEELSLQEIEADLKTVNETLNEKKDLWLNPFERMIGIINRTFSSYFAKMGCCGEVCLNKSQNADDIDKYGLSILVKFRDDAQLRELSQAHHSGGECSVATMIFILSLQDLVEVPFRCVDEINQGMDPVNERKIFEFITASAENSSQYFLLTPKLLHDLPYSSEMRVHLVHNGPCLEFVEWDFDRFL